MKLLVSSFVILLALNSACASDQNAEEKSIVIGRGEAHAPCSINDDITQESPIDALKRAYTDAIDQCGSDITKVAPVKTETIYDPTDLWTCGLGYIYIAEVTVSCER